MSFRGAAAVTASEAPPLFVGCDQSRGAAAAASARMPAREPARLPYAGAWAPSGSEGRPQTGVPAPPPATTDPARAPPACFSVFGC